jgi:elongation factor Ts
MSQISATAVKALRDRTNMPMMECKAALTEAGGDMEKAVENLRKKFKDAADKRVDRETAEGRIAVFIDPAEQVGAIVEVRCESPPVAKGEHFTQLANDLARVAALSKATTVEELLAHADTHDPKRTVADRIQDVIGLIRENMKVARFTRMNGLVGGYAHHDGSVGVLVQVTGDKAEAQLLRDVSMHITAKNPAAARREDVQPGTIDKEKEIALAQMQADPKNAGKPANILAMIVEGKMKSWFADNVLVEQPFVKDDTKTVGELLKSAGLTMGKFVRYKVGELT